MSTDWDALERDLHERSIEFYEHEYTVRAHCRYCGWWGPSRPPVKRDTWAQQDVEKHLAGIRASDTERKP